MQVAQYFDKSVKITWLAQLLKELIFDEILAIATQLESTTVTSE